MIRIREQISSTGVSYSKWIQTRSGPPKLRTSLEIIILPLDFSAFRFQFSQTLIIVSSSEQQPEIMWIYDARKYSLLIACEASKKFFNESRKHFSFEKKIFS